MKRKCRVIAALVLIFSMMFGTQALAALPEEAALISMAAIDGTDLDQVKVGDVVYFHISMDNTTNADLAGSRLVVTAKSMDEEPAGEVVIPEEGNPEALGDKANGNMKGISSAFVKSFGPGESISDAIAYVKVAEDMAGKQVVVTAFLSIDSGEDKPIVSNTAQSVFSVAAEEVETPEPSITIDAVPSIDLSKGITKEEAFQITLKVTNSGNMILQNIQVDAAYSGKDPEEMEEADFLKSGTIVSKGDFTVLDDGSAYLAELGIGDAKELTFECRIPKEYAQEYTNLYLRAGAFESPDLTGASVAQGMVILNSKILDAQNPIPAPETKPTPGQTPTPGTIPDTKPIPEVKPVIRPAKVQPVKLSAKSPQTGDEAGAAGWVMLMVCAGGAVIAAMKRIELGDRC